MEATDLLKAEKQEQEVENYKENEINWLDNPYYDSWDKVVGHAKKIWKHKKTYPGKSPKWFFLAHSKDIIVGKPQMIEDVKIRMPLVRLAVKTEEEFEIDKEGKKILNDKGKPKKTGNEIEIQSFYMVGEKFDKRHDGFQQDAFALDFYKYMIKTADDKRYFIFSQTKLPEQTCTIIGMKVELDDLSEMNRTLKIPMLSNIFFARSAEPAVKIISKEELVKYTKTKGITEFDWLTYLATHKFGTINSFPMETEMLKSAWLLSGKMDGWPLHLMIMGTPGTRKTMGWAETLANKFVDEEEGFILDTGNSTLKGLTLSYKGTITEQGFLLRAERVAIVDEIMALVEKEMQQNGNVGSANVLKQIDPILEHKRRQVNSGNTADCAVVATSKILMIGNPLSNKAHLHQHIGSVAPSTMGRMLWWVQNPEEVKFVLSPNGIIRPSPKTSTSITTNGEVTPKTFTSISNWDTVIENRKNDILLKKSFGLISSRDEFLTLFDSCYNFVSDIPEEEVNKLIKTAMAIAHGAMADIFEPRARHHVYLLVDGLVKHRCLFKDYDATFTPKQEDYDLAERILIRMVKAWDTDLSPKEDRR